MSFPGENLIIKMWDSLVDKGIGGALQPYQEKRMGDARLEIRKKELVSLAKAEKEADEIRTGKLNSKNNILAIDKNICSLPEKIEPRIDLDTLSEIVAVTDNHESIRRIVNTSNAIVIAENILAEGCSDVPDKNIDDDWLYSWREFSSKTSTKELQDLWGRILAGEVKEPGAFSYRTLEFIKGLSKYEAEIINRVAQFVVSNRIWRDKDSFLNKEGLNFSHLILLQNIGFISGVEAVGLETTWSSLEKGSYIYSLVSHDKAIGIHHSDPDKLLVSTVFIVTEIGEQILSLEKFNANIDYLESIAKDITKQGFDVVLGDWVIKDQESANIINSVKFKAENL